MKKIGLIAMVAVLALGALGVGYAAWTETLDIDATVNTGDLDADFTLAVLSDSDAGDTDGGTISIAEDLETTPTPSKTATLTLSNAYPGFTGTAVLTVTNTGTIPILAALNTGSADAGLLITDLPDGAQGPIAVGGTQEFTVTIQVDPAVTLETQIYTASWTISITQGLP